MATKYVTKTGNDTTGDGTSSLPYLTISKALTVTTDNDTINIGEGTWAENIGSYSRTFQGVSMFKTIVSSVTTVWVNKTVVFNDIKIIHNLAGSFPIGGSTGSYTFNRAWHDMSAAATALLTYTEAAITVTYNYSILSGNSLAMTYTHFSLGATFNFSHSVIVGMYATGYLFNTNNVVSIENSIWYLPVACPISLGSQAFVLEQYNCWYAPSGTITSKPGGAFNATDILTNPSFVDLTGFDLRLASNSPCIGTGHA